MRKSREGLAGVVREKMQRDPYTYGDAFIFYSKDLKKVKILHYDISHVIIHLVRSRKKRSLDTIKWRKVQSDKFFKKSC